MVEHEFRKLSNDEIRQRRRRLEAEGEGLIEARGLILPDEGPMFEVTIKGDGLRPNLAGEILDGGNKSEG